MNKTHILRAVGLLGVLILLTGSMMRASHPVPVAIMYVPDAQGCQITYPAGIHRAASDSLPAGALLSGECLVAR